MREGNKRIDIFFSKCCCVSIFYQTGVRLHSFNRKKAEFSYAFIKSMKSGEEIVQIMSLSFPCIKFFMVYRIHLFVAQRLFSLWNSISFHLFDNFFSYKRNFSFWNSRQGKWRNNWESKTFRSQNFFGAITSWIPPMRQGNMCIGIFFSKCCRISIFHQREVRLRSLYQKNVELLSVSFIPLHNHCLFQ